MLRMNLMHPRVRKTKCEALLGVVFPTNCAQAPAGQDVVWYVDSLPACQLLVKGSGSVPDPCIISALTQLLLARLGCRVHWEYIESYASPADGLSREGRDSMAAVVSQTGCVLLLRTAFDSAAEPIKQLDFGI